MGMFDQYNVFPTLKTKRIIIHPDNRTVTIQGLLSTKQSSKGKSTWLGTSKFTQYVKICFAIVPEMFMTQRMAPIFSPGSRFIGQNTFRKFESDYATVSINLDEVLQNDYASSVGATDLESGLEINDLFFEVVVDMFQSTTTEPEYSFGSTSKSWITLEPGYNSWHAIGFIHFDYESFQEDYSEVTNLNRIGGNCTTDLLLERKSTTRGAACVEAPRTINVYTYAETWPPGSMHLDVEGAYDAEGNPIGDGKRDIDIQAQFGELYFGLVHYHDGDLHENYVETMNEETGEITRENQPLDPLPDYVGWMGGHPQDPGRGPKLNVATIPNNKIIAPATIRPPVERGTRVQNRYNGAPDDWFFQSYDEDTENVNLQKSFNQIYEQDIDSIVQALGENIRKTVSDFKRQVVYKQIKSKSNVLILPTCYSGIKYVPNRNWRPGNNVADVVRRDSCHQILFSVSIEQILALKSTLGWLMEYHIYNNPGLAVSFVNASMIRNLTMSRRRLSNFPEGNSPTSAADFTLYDNDEIPKLLVSTTDQVNGDGEPSILIPQGNWRTGDPARIESIGQIGGIRMLYLEDYDLFHNVTYGNYRHSIKFDLIDGIKKVVEIRLAGYYEAKKEIQTYLRFASIPAVYEAVQNNQNNYATRLLNGFDEEQTRTTQLFSGCYDHERDEFTAHFRSKVDDYRRKIEELVITFVRMYQLLDNTSAESRLANEEDTTWREYAEFMIENLSGRANPSMIDVVMDYMDNVATVLEGILGRGKVSKYERITSGLGTSQLETYRENKLINVEAKIPKVATAFSRTQIFYEPSLPDSNNAVERLLDNFDLDPGTGGGYQQ